MKRKNETEKPIKKSKIEEEKPLKQSTIKKISETHKIVNLPDDSSSIEIYNELPEDLRISDEQFKALWNTHPNYKEKVKMFGELKDQPRFTRCYGKNSYNYSGVDHKVFPLENEILIKLLDWVKKDSGEDYEDILVNWYENGKHYIGPHSDDEKSLVHGSAIYSFSFGASRRFVVTSKKNQPYYYEEVFPVRNNTLLIMKGDMQKHFKHSVPIEEHGCPKRINVTIRLFKKK